MNKLRIEQRKGEGIDLTIIRAFANALESMPRHVAVAASRWMYYKSIDDKTVTADEIAKKKENEIVKGMF